MSIAVSTLIKPSRFLHLSLIIMNAFVFIALIWSMSLVKNVQLIILLCFSILLWLGSLWVQIRYVKKLKIIQLHIARKGRLILRSVDDDKNFSHGERVELLPASVVWSFLMMLHFKTIEGNTIIVPILWDSVDKDSFRRLSVAMRWLMIRLDANK